MSVAEINIHASVPVSQAPPLPVTTICPPPSPMFHGRRNVLDKMHAYFSQDIGRRHVCLLHGLGGAGKTQICLKFLDETDKARFMDVFFLDASTIDTIKDGLKNIALTRSIGSNDEDASRWLASSQEEWLLIFDNADDPGIKLFKYFPQSSSGNILITSRNPQLYVHAPNCYHHISDMEEEDAVHLLLASAIQPLTIETQLLATDIVKALYCFPLAIVQAGAYIAKTQKLRKYLTLYQQNHAELLSRLPDQPLDKYAWSVYTTWDISFNCLGHLAAKFLQICSFLHYEGISEAIFSSAATYKHKRLGPTEEQMREPQEFLNNFLTHAGTWDELCFTDMTMEIQGYSLINKDPNTNLLSIHPLVHDWSRRTITDMNSTQQCTATILAMATMSTLDEQVFHISLLPHLNSVLHGKPKIAYEFYYGYVWVYYDSGHFNQSKELCVALLENREHILGSDHPETLSVMSSLAATYWKLGKFTDSLDLHVTVLQKRKQILGPEHPDTLAAMSSLAATYHSLGKLTEAEQLKVVVLEERKQIYGPEHPHTLHAMSSLAGTYWKLGKFTDAEELDIAVLEKRKQMLGKEHPDTLHAMSELAVTYHAIGKLTEAEELNVVVLEKRKQILGPDHPKTLRAMSNLAATYWNLGKFMDAKELYVAVLEQRRQLYGTEHPETLTAMANLGVTCRDLGKFREAEHLLSTVLKKKSSTLGPEHKETLIAQEWLARLQQHIEHHKSQVFSDSLLVGK
ncbi:P-loop containing nucleoside triphosphate hydrolase protein [Mycena rebaudengoi]|nr:P-loop containing nucleoside triphosphate hydrolase protein [Mycena rebaudengoi]